MQIKKLTAAANLVLMIPGATQFTLILSTASSWAHDLVRPRSAVLLIEYAPSSWKWNGYSSVEHKIYHQNGAPFVSFLIFAPNVGLNDCELRPSGDRPGKRHFHTTHLGTAFGFNEKETTSLMMKQKTQNSDTLNEPILIFQCLTELWRHSSCHLVGQWQVFTSHAILIVSVDEAYQKFRFTCWGTNPAMLET